MKSRLIILFVLFLNIVTFNLYAQDSSKLNPLSNSKIAKNKRSILNQPKTDRAQKQIIFDKENQEPKKKNIIKNTMVGVGALLFAGAVFSVFFAILGFLGFVIFYAPILLIAG